MPEVLTNIVTVSPFVGLLGWLFWSERADRKSKEKKLEEQSKQVLQVFQENVKVTEGLKNTVNNNTEALRGLTQSVYQALGGKNGRRNNQNN